MIFNTLYIRWILLGKDHLISGGVEENVPEQSLYFLPAVKNKLYFFVWPKDETIFLALIFANLLATP